MWWEVIISILYLILMAEIRNINLNKGWVRRWVMRGYNLNLCIWYWWLRLETSISIRGATFESGHIRLLNPIYHGIQTPSQLRLYPLTIICSQCNIYKIKLHGVKLNELHTTITFSRSQIWFMLPLCFFINPYRSTIVFQYDGRSFRCSIHTCTFSMAEYYTETHR